ncbi:MAG TPA: lipoate--protein ligase family protein [Gemmatimonadaceae bacterium]|nr:lipoate--protein ligase family protein [Gemmatimonadaceae bacterium]
MLTVSPESAPTATPAPTTGARALVRWCVLRSEPATGAENMALDEALMAYSARTGSGVLRVYGWAEPTLSLGRHQTARGRYDLERAAALGVRFVRRPTGGRAVLHHREITYAVAAPVDALGTLSESYRWINRLLLDGLARLGVDARESRQALGSRVRAPGVVPCFQEPAPGEIESGGHKLVGSAQLREGGSMLQHGSILVDDDQVLAAALVTSPRGTPPSPPRAATLRTLLGRGPTIAETTDALTTALRYAAPHLPIAELHPDAMLHDDVAHLRKKFADDDWTWRR